MWGLKEKVITYCTDYEFPTIVNKETLKPKKANEPVCFQTCNNNASENDLINTMLLGGGSF